MAYQPPAVNIKAVYPHAAGQPADANEPSFLDVTVLGSNVLNPGGSASGTLYDAWCLDQDADINVPGDYTALLYSSYELAVLQAAPGFAGTTFTSNAYIGNLDNINWLLNFYTGPASGYTWGEMQSAIWQLIGQPTSAAALPLLGAYDAAKAATLASLALSSGDGYVPEAGQVIGLILDPTDAPTGTHFQPLIIETKAAALGDFVWNDVDADGFQDSGEIGIGGVTVNLVREMDGISGISAGEVLATTTTDGAGHYSFKGLTPGLNYQVQFVQPTGFDGVSIRQADGSITSGTNSDGLLSDVVVLSAGENNTSIDAGFYKPVVAASLGDRLWLDTNGNGQQDGGEAGVVGATVTLIGGGADGLINGIGDTTATTTTGANGVYSFAGLTPGAQYQVQFAAPAGMVFTAANVLANGADAVDSDADQTTGKTQIVTLAAGENNPTLDAGVYVAAKLSGYVYKDAGNDGVRNGEPGIAGVTLTLTGTDGAGNPVTGTTTTDANGFYQFLGLPPGTYTVTEAQPAGYIDGKDTVGSTGGSNAVNDVLSTIVLGSGANSVENNFGEIVTASLGDRLWVDTNGNGKQDDGTTGIVGATVTLIGGGADGLINGVGDTTATTTTGADGVYSFTGLTPGQQYQVQFAAPAGMLFTATNVSANGFDTIDSDADQTTGKTQIVTLAAGENNPTLDAGVYAASKLSGYVYQDAGDDGVRNSEPAIAGVTLKLSGTDGAGNAVTATTTTNAAGYYEFVGLAPGSYTVTETQPVAYLDGKETAGSTGGNTTVNDVISAITLVSGANSTENNFGEIVTASLGDRLWVDANGNGKQDTGEVGISGQSVTLIGGGADGLINGIGDTTATTTTGADGIYSFLGLTPGTQYQVQFAAPAGMVFTTANVSADGFDTIDSDADKTTGKTQVVTLAQGENNPTLDAGVYKLAQLSGFVYVDAGNDGVRNAEPGIAGVTLTLTGTDGAGNAVTATTTTGANGAYSFTGLAPGSYTVTEGQPAAYIDGKDTAGSTGGSNAVNDVLSSITLVSGANSIENNFGELNGQAHLGDFVWKDLNANGVQDVGETGIAGVTVSLKNAAGTVVATTTTNATGQYGFDVAPGTYSVQFTNPTGYVATTRDASGNTLDATDSDISSTGATGNYTLVNGDNNLSIDAGYYQLASLGDRIWYDKNANGIQDAGETGIAGVKLDLYSIASGSIVGTTTTDANGNYLFANLTPSTYFVDVQEATLPAGYIFTKPNVGANDAVDSDVQIRPDMVPWGATLQWGQMANTTLISGESDLTWDAGVYKVGIDVEKYVSGTTCTTVNVCGGEGANVSYWKNNCSSGTNWSGITNCKGTDSFNAVFGVNCSGGSKSLYNILCGTSTAAIDVWQRECVTAYLNSSHNNCNYAYSRDQVCGDVKYAVSCGNYSGCSAKFSCENNLGCSFTNTQATYNCTVDTQLYDADAPPGLEVKTGSVVTFTYIVKNTGDTALKDVVLTDDRIQTVTYVSGDTNSNGLLDTTESWTYKATEVAVAGTIKNTGTVTATDNVGGVSKVTDKDDAYYTGNGALKGSLGDRVWLDANANGVQDAGEVGVAGIKVTLKGAGVDGTFGTADDTTATTTTAANGAYLFGNLDAGKYQAVFSNTTGYDITKQNQGGNDGVDSDIDGTGTTAVITLGAGEQNLTVDAGLYKDACIGDRIWYDKNANGIQDAGEAGIAGVKLDLIDNATGASIGVATTNATGYYAFTNITPGSYHIDVQESTLPSGFIFTKANQGTNDAVDSDVFSTTSQPLIWGIMANTTLSSGENDTSWDAGAYKVGIDVEKYVSSTTSSTTTSCGGEGANVSYWKSNCSWQTSLGTYGWSGTGCKYSDSFNSVFGVSCNGGTKSIYDVLCGTSTAALDVLMRECVSAYLNACHTNVDYAYTKAQVLTEAKYAIGCGNYSETCNSFTRENSLGCNWSGTKTTQNCNVDTQLYDADAPPGLEVKTGSVVTFTYIVKNTGDTALKNVVLTDDRIATVSYVSGDTDNDGQLDVTETWTYKATEVAASGTIKNTGTVTALDAAGGVASVTDKDDAYYTGNGATKGSIGDRVWLDADGDGMQEAGEAGITGVQVKLTGAGADSTFGTADDITATTTTGANGYYLFSNLDAGKYKLDFNTEAGGYTATKQNQGANDTVDSDIDATGNTAVVTLAAGQQNLTVDAGVFKKASVGDRVWQDSNHNNIQDTGEAGIGGITVKLLSSTGAVLATTLTNASGNYLFSNLDPGAYTLQFDKTNVIYQSINMNLWKWAVKDTGTNDAVDSDVTGNASATTNVTVTSQFSLVSGQNDMTKDAGLTPIVIDLNGDGIQTISRGDATGSFDLFGNGKAITSGWISGSDGFLAVDKNGNGSIDDINELFGGNTKGAGFAQLASFDSNGDGVVDKLDAAFGDLRIWQDVNGNHSTDAGELMTLAQAGIASLMVAYTELPFVDAQGNLHLERSAATLSSGADVSMTDVYFNVSADDALAAGVALPTMADLLSSDTLDTVVGAGSVSTLSPVSTAAVCDTAGDAGEALRRIAMLTREECHHAAA